ncbi:6190_t:CDS:2 [Cetraspora pellucida]|uniref:6190_t:CDS:1 n=1 Tax=Cetraspora pellucida TaxID=1433469 RepID=A0A9N8ZQN6_9GLOM|nr:6190_t:CDS:2 [Cetraspora pellucida]
MTSRLKQQYSGWLIIKVEEKKIPIEIKEDIIKDLSSFVTERL